MDRRTLLAGVGTVAATAASTFPAPAIAQGIRELKMVTSWSKNFPGLGTSAERLARLITQNSGGRLQVKVFPAGELVDAFEVFDAVSAGLADMYHTAEYYWIDRSPAFGFFAAVPFGLTPNEMFVWVHHGGGQELWDELSAGFNIKSILCTNTGVQMGGWFAKEITSPESYKGLRFRMPGLGGKVIERLGATVITLPAGEIVPALESGALDAAEYVGPWNDLDLGLYKAAKFYYYPGFHEPGTGDVVGINKELWDGFSTEEQQVIETAAAAEYSYSLATFNANNRIALKTLINEHGVKLRKFDDSILRALHKLSDDVVAEIATSDPLTQRVYDSFSKFRKSIMTWTDLSERAFLNARSL
jgi:TRAP-type mannitol/chloroaromatic compound transport system substrate-binding protein